ncbi:MAG: PD-(D/E)XK nuclease-like domain-containing protein [Planctomycetota bacterium]|nr:PD-(D/E)XK nuclease-like domain-containing protein [Planctomycetota bacterium]
MLLACIIQEPDPAYRAKAKEFVSSHQLADFRRCPALFFKKRQGVVPDEDRPAYILGRAAHTLILEGRDRFERQYAFGGPVNPRTGTYFGVNTKAYAEWAVQQGKPVLTDEQVKLIVSMSSAVRSHQGASALLSDGVAEGVVRTEYGGLPCQIRMDWFNPQAGIVDLKTCDDLTWFESDARRFNYTHQLAFYRTVLAKVINAVPPVHLIAVEKKEPFRCGVWLVAEQALAHCQGENEAALARLKECFAKDTWPTGYEERRVFDSI